MTSSTPADPITVRADAYLDEVVDEDERPLGRILAADVLDALKRAGLKARLPRLLRWAADPVPVGSRYTIVVGHCPSRASMAHPSDPAGSDASAHEA